MALRDTAEHPRVFALRGRDPGTLASQLDVIAASAAVLSDAGLDGLARQLAVSAVQADDHPAPLRVALTAASPDQLAGQAEHAARLLRTSDPAADLAGLPDMRISAGAGGTVVVLFPGRAESAAGQPALFAASLQALGTLDMLGVRPATGVGYGLAEITGLAWAGCLPTAEAARLVAQCGQVLRACACRTAAMARVTADAEMARTLAAPGHLHIAAYEGTRTHVLAGSTAGIRELTRRAGMARRPGRGARRRPRDDPRCTSPAWPGAPPRCGASSPARVSPRRGGGWSPPSPGAWSRWRTTWPGCWPTR